MARASVPLNKPVTIDRKLVEELKTLLKGQKGVDVIGHLSSPALCCGNGTVALVRINRGYPAPRTRTKTS